jgi:CRP-like cAMP-binding protein
MDYSILLKTPLFRGLSVEEIERMLAIVSYRTRKFKSGTLIVQSGEQVNSLMVVIKGIVKGEMTDFAGRVIKIIQAGLLKSRSLRLPYFLRLRFPC